MSRDKETKPAKNKCHALRGIEKKEICQIKKDNPTIKMAELAKQFECAIPTVSEILSNSDFWLNIDEESTIGIFKRRRQSNFPNIEEALGLWVENAVSDKVTLMDSILKEKAKKFAILFDNYEFGATNGWLEGFKKRNSLKSYKKKGEAGSVDLTKLPEQRTYLKSILEGKKLLKDRVSILATCNATGEEKLPLLFINNSNTPRSLRGIDKTTLGIWYYYNKSAWMQRSIFESYLRKVNNMFRLQNRKIILLADNVSSHKVDDLELSNIKLHFLPPNTLTQLQPLDQGIIYSLKVFIPKVTILDAINFVVKAWDCVKTQTVTSSWTRADILPVSPSSIPITYATEEIEEVKREIADLIQRLPMDEPMNIEEYIDIDKNAEIYSFTDENGLFQEIVDTVNHIETLEEDEPSEEQIVTSSEALLGCDNMLAYIAQKNLNVDYFVINTLNKLRKEISRTSMELARQTTLQEYLTFDV
ncbi:17114_t:CDS:2 [Acaulospora morrowiae]|uniref:17114_t:CDS:1 n=1 Tax=Acaulospora morrowiae TaxID=94023 RepID=A0A9N9CFA8_9GLOM|nr:17114_t:CDS:2 [Acaulospora morrowiae]